MSLSKELFNSGKSNNIAILSFKYIFSVLLTIGTIFAILAETTNDIKWLEIWFPVELIDIYIKLMNLIFAGLILIIGEPTKYGWDTKKILSSFDRKGYTQKYINDISILKTSIRNLKTIFSKNWNYLWGAWTLLYLVLAIHSAIDYIFAEEISKTVCETCNSLFCEGDSKPISNSYLVLTIIENSLNYLSSYFLFALYLILVFKSEPDTEKTRDSNISYHQNRKKFIFICVFLILAEVIIYLTLFSIYPEINAFDACKKQATQIIFLSKATEIFQLCNGLIASIALALFIGRLIGSHTTVFRLKETVILPVLYLYCAIQPLFVYVGGNGSPLISFGVLAIALLCKFLLYYKVVQLFDSRRILFHFIETMSIRESVKMKLPDFQKIWIDNENDEE